MPRIWALPSGSLEDSDESNPDVLYVYGRGMDGRDHIWVENTHYEQSGARTAEIGKCYYSPEPGIFYRVKGFEESDDDPVTEYGVENAFEKVILEILVGPDGIVSNKESGEPRTDWANRYQLEAAEMGMIPFERR